MSVKFFGQFLIEQGEIDGEQLRAALSLMDRRNKALGEVCVEAGFLSEQDADRVNGRQRTEDRPFGDLAVEMGLVTSEQVEAALERQQSQRLFVGEALVELGHLGRDRLEPLLAGFKADQEPYQAGDVKLPEPFDGNALAAYVLDLLPKFCMRMSRLHAKLSPPAEMRGQLGHPFRLQVRIRSERDLAVTFACDHTLARWLAAGASGLDPERLDDELMADGVGEFMNVLAGNAVSALERDGTPAQLEPPQADAAPESGYVWAVVTTEGTGLLVLEPC